MTTFFSVFSSDVTEDITTEKENHINFFYISFAFIVFHSVYKLLTIKKVFVIIKTSDNVCLQLYTKSKKGEVKFELL